MLKWRGMIDRFCEREICYILNFCAIVIPVYWFLGYCSISPHFDIELSAPAIAVKLPMSQMGTRRAIRFSSHARIEGF